MGFRRVYLAGFGVFAVASVGAALAPGFGALVAFRVLQGLGAAAVMSLTAGMIRHTFPQAQLGRAIGINAMVVAVSGASAPGIAAAVLSVAPWPFLFLVHVPLGLLGLAVGARALPDPPRARRSFDTPSAALNVLAFGLLFLGLDLLLAAPGLALPLMGFGAARRVVPGAPPALAPRAAPAARPAAHPRGRHRRRAPRSAASRPGTRPTWRCPSCSRRPGATRPRRRCSSPPGRSPSPSPPRSPAASPTACRRRSSAPAAWRPWRRASPLLAGPATAAASGAALALTGAAVALVRRELRRLHDAQQPHHAFRRAQGPRRAAPAACRRRRGCSAPRSAPPPSRCPSRWRARAPGRGWRSAAGIGFALAAAALSLSRRGVR